MRSELRVIRALCRQIDRLEAQIAALRAESEDQTLVRRREGECLLCGGTGDIPDASRQDLVECPACAGAGGAT